MSDLTTRITTEIIDPAFEREALREVARECGYDIDGVFTIRERKQTITRLVDTILKGIQEDVQSDDAVHIRGGLGKR